jgi:predicted MPP superfamily phosphohydrolase
MNFRFQILMHFLHLIIAAYENINILHLTDLHYDVYFKSNSSIYSFCHRNSIDFNDEKSNLLWGRECDSSGSLIQTSLMHIAKHNHNLSVILLTGDNIR